MTGYSKTENIYYCGFSGIKLPLQADTESQVNYC